MRATTTRRWAVTAVTAAGLVLVACSSNHAANPNDPAATAAAAASTAPGRTVAPSTASGPDTTTSSSTATDSSGSTTTSTSASTTTSTAASLTVTGRAVAGTAGGVETVEPFALTDPFSEVVRLVDGTCVGWSGSRGGSTVGLAVGTPVLLLETDTNTEVGTGSITASRWEDVGNEQFNCSFDFSGILTAPRAEFRIKVGALAPWLARPDPALPGTFTASVSTDASIGLIPECPAVPAEPDPGATTTTIVPPTTTVAAAPVTGWNAVGQYWSNGIRSLCAAGLPVTAIARPCRPPGVGSEYISAVVDSADPTVTYADGSPIPAGTALTVVVATGRPCE